MWRLGSFRPVAHDGMFCAFRRALAEEDSRDGEAGSVAEAVGPGSSALYQQGSFQRSGLTSIEAYLTRKVMPA